MLASITVAGTSCNLRDHGVRRFRGGESRVVVVACAETTRKKLRYACIKRCQRVALKPPLYDTVSTRVQGEERMMHERGS